MGEIKPLEVPKWGMTMEEGTVGDWLVAVGESFTAGQPIVTVESSKISNDLEAPFASTLRRIVAGAGETLPVGALIGVAADDSVSDAQIDAYVASRTATAPSSPPPHEGAPALVAGSPTPAAPAAPVVPDPPVATARPVPPGTVRVPDSLKGTLDPDAWATPHALAFAREHGMTLDDVPGTGTQGRITVRDLREAIEGAGGEVPAVPSRRVPARLRSTLDDAAVRATPIARRRAEELGVNLNDCRATGSQGRVCLLDVEEAAQRLAPTTATPPAGGSCCAGTEETQRVVDEPERIPFTPMRRTIGSRLQSSYQTSPHFRVRTEVEMDAALELRAQINATVPGVHASVNDLVVKAVALALVRVPDVNVQFEEATQTILRFPHADVAVAVAVPDGLITPIVRRADTLGLGALSGTLRDLATRAKAGKLGVDEFQGGTFTVSNLGMLGVSGFDAIINPPQVAILAVGAGVRRVVVADDGSFQARTVMEICLSGDHRVIDGATGATFVGEVKAILESPAQMLV